LKNFSARRGGGSQQCVALITVFSWCST